MNESLTVIPPAELLQAVQVIPATTREFIETAIRRACTLEVTTDAELAQAAECLNSLTKGISTVEEAVTEARRPVLAFAAALTETAAPLKEGAKDAKDILGGKIKLYRDQQEAKRQAALAEQRRLEAEAKAKAEAEAQARAKAAAEAAAKAEAAKREQERLKWEAEERERLAAEGIMAGNKTADQVEANAKALAQASELDKQAEQARLDAEEAEYLSQEAAAHAAAPVVLAPVAAPVVLAPAKVKGVKTKRVVDGLEFDVAKLPAVYLECNEALLKRHILDGAVDLKTPGVKAFQIVELVTGTGR